MNTKWNIAFTNILRQTNQASWGNWNLSPDIKPGAVGFIDPDTGSFTLVNALPNAKIVSLNSPEDWTIESSSVHKTESDIDFKGGYKDPSSGKEVNVGLKVDWSFSEEGSLASNATVVTHDHVDNFGIMLQKNYDWLLEQAESVGWAPNKVIAQGFGMITNAKFCTGGVNIASLDKESDFSITGSVDGVTAMTGGGTASASLKGSYKETDQTKAFESHLWPSEVDSVAPQNIGISYQFASFDGKLIMPTWITPLSGFTVILDNAHGGSYIGNCTVSYNVPGKKDPVTQGTHVPGGQNHTIDGIPLNATNLKIEVDFEAGSTFHFSRSAPLAQLPSGVIAIDMSGVWPWGAHAKIRNS